MTVINNVQYLKDCETGLKRYDINNDGKTTVEEYKNVALFGDEKIDEAAFKSLEAYAGTDGVITAQEYAYWLNSKDYDDCVNAFEKKCSQSSFGTLGTFPALFKMRDKLYAAKYRRSNPADIYESPIEKYKNNNKGLISTIIEFFKGN